MIVHLCLLEFIIVTKIMQILKWFYDTFTGLATRAARYGSFVGERFGLLVASY
jgi:hypothetical protein